MAQNWSILAKFPPKNPAKLAVFYWLFLGEVSPRNFPWHRPIFLTICPWKSFEIWLFSAKIPRSRPIFLRILTFLPRKSHKIGRFLREFWLFSRENCLFFLQILTFFPRKSHEISRFFCEFPPEKPAKFCFFSAKYQKPCARALQLRNSKSCFIHLTTLF